MSLKQRFFLFSVVLMLISSLATWSWVKALAEDIIEQWAIRYAETQVLYDRQRTLQPLTRELALSRQFSQSQALIDFARQPENPDYRRAALQEMENFRFNFLQMNYFVALSKTGEYFHNDANNTYQNNPLRYRLSPDDEKDAWFHQMIREKRPLHVNVNHDPELSTTNLWINMLLQDSDGQALGVVGTGLNLSELIKQSTGDTEQGVNNIFIDQRGAIQLHRDPTLINFSSLTQARSQLSNVESLLRHEADKQRLQQAMDNTRNQPDRVFSHYVETQNGRQLMAVAYLPEIEWHKITLIDISKFLPIDRFTGIFAIYALTLGVMILLINLALRYLVFRPISKLDASLVAISQGKTPHHPLQATGELKTLMEHFNHMSDSLTRSAREAKQREQQQQIALEKTLYTDALTLCLNQQGMMHKLAEQAAPPYRGFGLLRLQLDLLQEINERYGYHQGDKALQRIAGILKDHIEQPGKGSICRWSGGQFLVCTPVTESRAICQLAEKIRQATESSVPDYACDGLSYIPLTISVGAYISSAEDDLYQALNHSDAALQEAKTGGRNRVQLFRQSGFSLSEG